MSESTPETTPEPEFGIQVKIEDLRKRSLFVATPMYGGQCHGMFTRSMMDLAALCKHYDIKLQTYFLFNESLITRARNYCVDVFMRSDCTHMMFIDSDIGFNPNDVIALLAMQGDDDQYDIIGAPYPKKCIAWEKIEMAVHKGLSADNPNVLENFVGDYVFNPKHGGNRIPLNRPCEVLEIGTGFMMIKKKTLQKFFDAFKDKYSYRPDHVRTEDFDGSREILQYFQAEIDPVSKRYLSEDYWFCQKVQEIGLKTWICPWMKLQHAGSFVFAGSLIDLAALGATATADVEQLNKYKKKKK